MLTVEIMEMIEDAKEDVRRYNSITSHVWAGGSLDEILKKTGYRVPTGWTMESWMAYAGRGLIHHIEDLTRKLREVAESK